MYNINLKFNGRINPLTNITNNDLLMSAKIALVHLNEFSNYLNKFMKNLQNHVIIFLEDKNGERK